MPLSERVHGTCCAPLGQMDVLVSPPDVAKHGAVCRDVLTVVHCERDQVPVLEASALRGGHDDFLASPKRCDARLNGIDGRPVGGRDVDSMMRLELAVACLERGSARWAVEGGARIAEVAADRMR